MKVLLLKDIPGIGKRNAVVNVSTDYASSYLFPGRLAIEASEKNMLLAMTNQLPEAPEGMEEPEQAVPQGKMDKDAFSGFVNKLQDFRRDNK